MSRKRKLTPDESRLWQRLTKSVRPMPPVRMPEVDEKAVTPSVQDTVSRQNGNSTPRSTVQRRVVTNKPSGQTHRQATRQPVNEAGDPRQTRHVSRGRRPIDATLDLHGLSQEQAFVALSRFLEQARAIGHATVLVITGKGAPDADAMPSYQVSRGILRRRFLDWADGPFREHISSISQSHQRHGGSGAFYVFLKKQR